MKKLLAVIMVLVLSVSLFACGDGGSSTGIKEKFDADKVLSQLEVEEYVHTVDSGIYGIQHQACIIVQNNSKFNIKISTLVKALDKEGNVLEVETIEKKGLANGMGTVLDCDYLANSSASKFDRLEYEFTVTEAREYDCVSTKLDYKITSEKGTEIVSVTNKSGRDLYWVTGDIVYYKDGKPVKLDGMSFENDATYDFPNGATITESFSTAHVGEYDSYKFFLYSEG